MSVPTSVLGLEQNEHRAITVCGPGAGSIAAIPSPNDPVSRQTIMRQASLDKARRHRTIERGAPARRSPAGILATSVLIYLINQRLALRRGSIGCPCRSPAGGPHGWRMVFI